MIEVFHLLFDKQESLVYHCIAAFELYVVSKLSISSKESYRYPYKYDEIHQSFRFLIPQYAA
jgi:hypothetical protein